MKAFKVLHDDWLDATNPANVWVETPNGLQPHSLLLGLADESYSEVLRSTLKAGDHVVTRVHHNGGEGQGKRGAR